MKKIVFYVNHFGNGGVDRHISNLANEFINRGYEISILVRGTILSNRLYKLDDRIMVLPLRESHKGLHKLDRLNIRIMGIQRNLRWLCLRAQQSFFEHMNRDSSETRKKRRSIEREKLIVKEYKQDNVHLLRYAKENRDSIFVFFSISVMEQFCYITKSINIKTVFAEARDPSRWTLNKDIMKTLLLEMNACVVQTRAQEKSYTELLDNPKKINIIYNPMPEYDIKHDQLKNRKTKIVNFCRMDPAKNLFLLVDSFCKLHDEYPNYTLELFVIADYDAAIKLKEELINYCKSKAAGDYICVLPGEKNILEKIVDYSMFVSSSLHEGLSNSMLEAMTIGLPCVCTDCDGGGAREVIIDGENGILVKSNDITALYLGMKKIIDNPQKSEEMGMQAMRIKEKTNIYAVATKWESIFEKLNCENN